MDIVKKNLLSVVCGIVAIVAIVAAYVPVGGWLEELHGKATERVAVYNKAERLLKEPHHLPLIDPGKTEPDELKWFPTESMIKKARDAQQDVARQSQAVLQYVVKVNQRFPLVMDSLPSPLSDTPKFRFRDLYKLVMSNDPADSAANPQSPLHEANVANHRTDILNLRNDILHGGIPPSADEITAAQAALFKNNFVMRIIVVNGQPINQKQIQDEFLAAATKVPDQLRTQVATSRKIYVDPQAFTVSANIAGTQAPPPAEIWMAQVLLWVQQDLCVALAEANGSAKNIIDAPVKHLLKMTLSSNPYVMQAAVAGVNGGPSGGNANAGGDTQVLPKVNTISTTGRVSNAMYDVIGFSMVLNVDARELPGVIETLSRNRLITVNNVSDVVTVNSESRRADGYIYGDGPVVQVTISGEELLMRGWTTNLMPQQIHTMLGIPPAIPGTGAQAMAQ